MTFLPFFLDRSDTAHLIRSIGKTNCRRETLTALVEMMRRTQDQMPYGHLVQILRRSSEALKGDQSQKEKEVLDELKRSSLWRIQRIHMEGRP